MDKKKLSFKDIMINYGVIIIVVLLVIYTGITSKNFLSVNNLTNILMNMSSRLVIALGIAGCIITAVWAAVSQVPCFRRWITPRNSSRT